MSPVTGLRVLLSRALDVMFRHRRDDRLSEEVETHLSLLADEYIERGMTAAEARQAARRTFGGVDQVKAAYREQRGLPLVDAVAQDLRFAARLLRRDRGFAATAVFVLGVGIGVNNMFFTIFNAHTLRGLPIPAVDRVVYVSTFDDRNPDLGVSYPDYLDLRDGTQSFASVAAFTSGPVAVAGDGRAAERFEAAFVSANAFDVIRASPALGRAFTSGEDALGAAPVAMLSTGAWHSRYGGDASILGRSILVDGAPATIVGVIDDRCGLPSTPDVLLPLARAAVVATQDRAARRLSVFGRLRDGVTVAEARAETEAIVDRLAREHPVTNRNLRGRAVPVNERYLGRMTEPAWLAFITAGCLVLLISSANVANLMLGRALHRTRELAIRTSLGASRGRLLRQLLIEGALLAALGGALGLGLSLAGARLFQSAIPDNVLPYWLDYTLDVRVVAALIAVSAATVFIFALLPAMQASKADVNRVLKDGGHGRRGTRGSGRWTSGFLTAEFALAFILLAAVVVSFRVARPSVPSEHVMQPEQVITAAVTLPAATYATAERRREFYRQLEERIRRIPGAAAVSITSALPLMGAPQVPLDIPGRPPATEEAKITVRTVSIGSNYFAALGLSLLRGRDFDNDDGLPGQAYAIVNERFAVRFFSGQDPIGEVVRLISGNATASTPLTIVGIAPDIRQRPVAQPEPLVYTPFVAAPLPTATLLVRSSMAPDALVAPMRTEVQALDPNLPLYRIQTLEGVRHDAQWNGRLSQLLIHTITFIAVTLSMFGLYAVTAHGVSQRTQEIGVRMALGAQTRHVVLLIVRRAALQLALGFIAGIFCTIAWGSVFWSGSADVKATDLESLAIIAALLTTAATIACFVPARRATRLDPVVAIRGD